jgi:hypothetical protein
MAGCGGAAGSGNSAPDSLRAAFGGQRGPVNGIVTQLRTTLAGAGPAPDALLSDQFSALGARAEHEAVTIDGLAHPPRYNTRLRDLGSALVAVAHGLDQLGTAATEHQPAAERAQIGALRVDAVAIRGTEATLAAALGLSSR